MSMIFETIIFYLVKQVFASIGFAFSKTGNPDRIKILEEIPCKCQKNLHVI